MKILQGTIRAFATLAVLSGGTSWAKSHGNTNGVPFLDVKSSCTDAQKFSSQGDDKNVAFKGCMQDEMSAKDTLTKQWTTYKPKDKTSCVEQARAPSPSYVEVLTCLEMNSGVVGTNRPQPKVGGAAPATVDAPAGK